MSRGRHDTGFSSIHVVFVLLVLGGVVLASWQVLSVRHMPLDMRPQPPVRQDPDGMPNETSSSLIIGQWNIQIPLTHDIRDAYYTYAQNGYITLSTRSYDKTLATMTCKVGPSPVMYETYNVESFAQKNTGISQEDQAIQNGSYVKKLDTYRYILEVPVAEPAIACVNSSADAQKSEQLQQIKQSLRNALKQAVTITR